MMKRWTDGDRTEPRTGTPKSSRGANMVERVSVSIIIGGTLSAVYVPELIELANSYGLTTEWEGEPLDTIPTGCPLRLVAHEVAGGHVDDIEDFCCTHDLPFRTWVGASHGTGMPEIRIWPGTGSRQVFAATEDETIVITEDEVTELGSLDAIVEHFRLGRFQPPDFMVTNWPTAGAD